MQISAPQPTAPQKFPLKNGQQAFEAKGGVVAPHAKFHNKRFVPPNATQFAPAATIAYPFKQPVIPIGKPKMGSIVNGGGGAVVTPRAPAQFPPTPSTIIKPPRFYTNQSIIVPKSKPGTIPSALSVDTDKDCICEREDAMIICQKCGSELLGRVQQKCAAHPRKIQLMDHQACLNGECKSIKLMEVSIDEEV